MLWKSYVYMFMILLQSHTGHVSSIAVHSFRACAYIGFHAGSQKNLHGLDLPLLHALLHEIK